MACEFRDAEVDDEPSCPDVVITARFVAVRFHKHTPWLVLDEDGTVTQRFTLPAAVAQLPLPPVARPVRVVELPGGAA